MGHPIPHTDILQKFADNLPENMSYITIRDDIHRILNGPLHDLPSFEEVADRIMNTHFNYLRMHPNASLVPGHAHPTTTSLSANTVVSPPQVRPVCTNPNCGETGHTTEQCWKPGGGNVGGCEKFMAEKAAK